MTTVFKKSLLVAGVASLLLTTGCAAASVQAAEAPASPTATATATPTETAVANAAATPPASYPVSFDSLIETDPMGVKAGNNLRATGGTIKPGAVATVYVAQLMAMPSQDATGMWHQVGEQIKLTAPVAVTVDEKGQYDIQIPIPAGITQQQVDVIVELTGVAPGDPTGGLSRTSIR